MEVDGDTVRSVDAAQARAVLRGKARGPSVCGIDVEVDAFSVAHVGDVGKRVDQSPVRGAGCGHYGGGGKPVRSGARDGCTKRSGFNHAAIGVRPADRDHVFRFDAEQLGGAPHRVVSAGGGEEREVF